MARETPLNRNNHYYDHYWRNEPNKQEKEEKED